MTKEDFDIKIDYLKGMGFDVENMTTEEFALYFNAANKKDENTEDLLDEKNCDVPNWME